MDRFELIDFETWPRTEIYRQYTKVWDAVTYTFTKKLNVATLVPYLKERGIKLIPTLAWLTSREINRVENFRLGIHERKLVRWEKVHPLMPTVNPTGNMSFISHRFQDDFTAFYENYLTVQQENREKTALWANGAPENYFFLSIMPWLEYDALSMQLKDARGYYAPYVAMGKFNAQMELPCTVMVNHATIDGWFVHQFYDGMQKAMDDPAQWCK